jgi:hypothetical protein
VTTDLHRTAHVTVSDSAVPAELGQWDDFVRSVPGADVAQLSGWARLRSHAGYRAVHLMAWQGGRLVGGAQILVRRIAGAGEVAYLAYGPLVAPEADDAGLVGRLLRDEIRRLGRGRFRFLFVQPPEGAEATSAGLLTAGFRPSDAGIAPRASLRIALDVEEAQLKKRLNHRLKINRWKAGGVTTRPSTAEDLPLLADLLAVTARHQGFPPFGLDYLVAMHEILAGPGHLAGFVGEVDGLPVAMMLLTSCGGVLKRRLVGFDRSPEVMRLNVPVAVDWAAMRWGRERGHRWYDFGGIDDAALPMVLGRNTVDVQALPGPDRYKFAFGGDLFSYPPPVEMIRPRAVRAGYDLARRTRVGRAAFEHVKRLARTGTGSPD